MKLNTLIPVVASVVALAVATDNNDQGPYRPRLDIHFEGADTPTPAQMQDGLDRMPKPAGDGQFPPQMVNDPPSQAKGKVADGFNRMPQPAGDSDFPPTSRKGVPSRASERIANTMSRLPQSAEDGQYRQQNGFPQRAQGGITSVYDRVQNSAPIRDGFPSQNPQNRVADTSKSMPQPVGQGQDPRRVREMPSPVGNGDTLDRMPEPIGGGEFPTDREYPPYPANRMPEPVGNGNGPADSMPEPVGDGEYRVHRMPSPAGNSNDLSPMPQPIGHAQPPQPPRMRRSRIHAARQQGDECGLLFVQASDNAYSGYVSEQKDVNGRYTVVTDKSQAIATKYQDHNIIPESFTGYDVLGATFGVVHDEQGGTGDERFRGNSRNFAMLTGTSRTAYGEGPSYGRSSFDDATGAQQRIESAVYNMGENGEIHPFWVDGDGVTTPSVWGVNAERQIVYSANIGQYNADFGGYSAQLFCQPLF